MQKKLTPKQEKFCQEISKGKNQYEAYLESYPVSKNWERNSVDNKASLLMSNAKIKQRLEELRDKIEKKISDKLVYTAKQSFDKLTELQKLAESNAMTSPNVVNAAIKAEELKGKLAKLYVDQSEDLTKREYQETVIRVIDSTKLKD